MSGVARPGPTAGLWAAVPYKGATGGKRRLAGVLDEAERALLGRAMLDDVLDALLDAPDVATVLLMAPDRSVVVGRGDDRLRVVADRQAGAADGLNRAVRAAQATARAGGADRLLVVPADLPLLTPADVAAVAGVAGAATGPAVVIAPDRSSDGTNALLLAPPEAIEPAFGAASFDRHRALAERAGLTVAVVERPGLALDMDTPADLARLLGSGQDCRTARLLRDLGVERRLSELLLGQARSTTI